MTGIGAVREVETWSFANIVGGLVVLAVVIGVLYWAIRRYLSD